MAETLTIEEIREIVPHLLKVPSRHVWIDYDEEADVLYINLEKPQNTTESKMEDNIILHYRDNQLVGISVIGAKKYSKLRI